ncbi:hypothetical protein DFQ27_000597, partial [Actinomortierella ambigua]
MAFAQQSLETLDMSTSNSAAPPTTSVAASTIPMRTATFSLSHSVPVGANVFGTPTTTDAAALAGGLASSLAGTHVPGTPVPAHPSTLGGMMMMSDL